MVRPFLFYALNGFLHPPSCHRNVPGNVSMVGLTGPQGRGSNIHQGTPVKHLPVMLVKDERENERILCMEMPPGREGANTMSDAASGNVKDTS